MSISVHVILEGVPPLTAWQAAISEAGFDLKLDPRFDTSRNTGFVPARFVETESGFEFNVATVPDSAPGYLGFSTPKDRRSLSANFGWSGDELEMCCALAAAAVLAKLTRGVLFEPADGVCYSGDEAIQIAKDEIADFVSGGTEFRPAE